MATKKAFPSPHDARVEGMDLRDYFAGQIIVGWLPGAKVDDEYVKAFARRAYQIADVLMEARGR